ncbi:MAG: hypothetical protein MI824_01990 [Hyphomicrobiales bacterium]|nr:hypothetical protein [Hyphomicrobiales bacterium]
MPIYRLYSRRKRRREQTDPDVYQYAEIPDQLRVQIRHIWKTAIGTNKGILDGRHDEYNTWKFIRDTICRERGVFSLADCNDEEDYCIHYLLIEEEIDEWLDIVELSFRAAEAIYPRLSPGKKEDRGISQRPVDATIELNFRFKESGIGYQFENGEIIRVDNQLIHSEIVKPALSFLRNPRFKGAEEEFLLAHGHYRAGEYKDAITDALNAFESTMKVICDIKGWDYHEKARASDLVRTLRANNLFPDYLDNSFDQLIATLSAGLPKVRNEEGSHGQGGTPRKTPSYVASYALHLAASKIVLLFDALKASE